MIGPGDAHRCWKVRIHVEPNIDEIFYVIAKDVTQAASHATAAFNSCRGNVLTPEQCVVEVDRTVCQSGLIWIH